MHEEFSKYGTPAIKLVEECSELIQAVCKGERFGYDNKNPLIENAPPTRQRITDEISDVENALEVFKKWLNELPEDIRRKENVSTGFEIMKLNDYYLEWSPKYKTPLTFGVKFEQFKKRIKEEYGNYGLKIYIDELEYVGKDKCAKEQDLAHQYDPIPPNKAGPNGISLTKEEIYKAYCLREPLAEYDNWVAVIVVNP